jgi:hypothetical protein
MRMSTVPYLHRYVESIHFKDEFTVYTIERPISNYDSTAAGLIRNLGLWVLSIDTRPSETQTEHFPRVGLRISSVKNTLLSGG